MASIYEAENPPNVGPGTAGHGTALTPEQVQNFIYQSEFMQVRSSNVRAARYQLEDRALVITYDGGTTWKYSPIDVAEALSFAQAESKNEWLWANVRIKGTKHAHRKTVTRVE
jgi:hypothetical protein